VGKTEELEKKLRILQDRLESVEKAVPLVQELLHLSESLNIPLNLYSGQLKQLLVLNGLKKKIPEVGKDEISKAIIQALLEKPGQNITKLSQSVAAIRGKASRRIISERLAKLEALGIAEFSEGKNNEKLFRLKGQKRVT